MPPSAARSRWHCNVGGGYSNAGLSDQALVWMIARLQALTGLEFDIDAVKAGTRPNISGAIVDSTKGWPIDHTFPHYRKILSPDAIHQGYVSNTADPSEEHINERIHLERHRQTPGKSSTAYAPLNLPAYIPAEKIASLTDQQQQLLERDT
jgi:hypothetical protein